MRNRGQIGFNSPNFPHIKTVSNDMFETVFGTPVWIRTSGLQRRSYQAVKPEALRRKGLIGVAQIFAILKKNLGSLIGQGFRDFSR